MAKRQYLECGKILTAHGVHGALRVESLCDTPEVLCSLPTVYISRKDGTLAPYAVTEATPHKGGALLTLAGLQSREDALLLRGKMLFAARADIPIEEGSFLIADMIGLPVIDADSGRVYGKLSNVTPSPASDLYDVLTPDGQHVLLPAVPAFLDRIDIDAGIYIRPISGFFEDEEDGHAV
ncbi:MAG: 16S rRNA processing protein RimM [Clostridia bacterium]|nr:16S rRNA processing protein RimM [Clostridia bacterium]